MVGGVAHPVRRHGKMRDAGGTPGIRPGEVRTASVPCTRRCLVAGASCCERLGRRASPVWRRRQCKWAANVAMAPMQVGCQCGVVVNVGGTLNAAAPSNTGGTLNAAAPSTQRHPNNTAIPNNEPAFAPEAMLHRLRACLSSAKSRNPMSPVH